MKDGIAGAAAVAGVVLALASVTVLAWGLGMVIGVVMFIGGFGYLTDHRPASVRRGRGPWGE